MFTRLSLVGAAWIALVVGQPAGGSPITYDFTGTIAPFNGSSQISGSFTINGDPTGFNPEVPRIAAVTEGGNDVSLTVNMGGHMYNFVNQLNPDTVAAFIAGLSPTSVLYPSSPTQNEASIYGATQSGNPLTTFGMSFYNDDPFNRVTNLRHFDLPLNTGSIYVTNTSGSSFYESDGIITSIELVPTPTPEPSTLAIFAILGAAAMARWRRA